MGGPSAEHEISLKTGEMVFKHLDRTKYQPKKIIISKRGQWPITFKQLKDNFDVAFIALHGEYGEDGTVQKTLKKLPLPYTGSDSRASKLGMDKTATSRLLRRHKLATPPFTVSTNKAALGRVNSPLVVKPVDRGSSVGVSLVHRPQDLVRAVQTAQRYSPRIMFQKYVAGKEITCGVLEQGKRIRALPPTEITPTAGTFFDYHAKYTPGASREITPPNLPPRQIKKIREMATRVHRLVGCRGYSRTDMILGNDGQLYVLEINTLPGLTEASLIPQAAQAVGINFSKLLDVIIQNALKR